MNILKLITLMLCLNSLQGCSVVQKDFINQGMRLEKAAIDQITEGDSKQTVINTLGSSNIININDNRLDYVQYQMRNNKVITHKVLEIHLENDIVSKIVYKNLLND